MFMMDDDVFDVFLVFMMCVCESVVFVKELKVEILCVCDDNEVLAGEVRAA